MEVYGVSINSRGRGVQLTPQTNVWSPSLPPPGDSHLSLLCVSTPALSTPHCSPRTNTPESQPGCQQCGGIGTKDCGRGAFGTFILFSLPLCFQSNSTSVNKHRPGTLSRPLLSAPYGLQTWRTCISTSCTAGLKKPVQRAESSLQVTACTVSCFQPF